MRQRSRDDWLAVVMADHRIQGETRALLLYSATYMDHNRKFSVPQSQLARRFDVSKRTIRGRIEKAREVGLLVTVLPGKPGRTSVYQGTFPSPSVPYVPHKRASEFVLEGAHKQSPTSVRPVVPPSSKRSEWVTSWSQPTELVARSPRSGEPGNHGQHSDFNNSVAAEGGDRETLKGLPDWLRKALLDEIQIAAQSGGYATDELIELLDEYDPRLGDWARYKWTFSRKAVDRYMAGAELNKLIATFERAH